MEMISHSELYETQEKHIEACEKAVEICCLKFTGGIFPGTHITS